MTRDEAKALRPWVKVGVGVSLDRKADELLVRKGYLVSAENGYALTPRGARQAAARL